jgi:homoserine dehydrogenase
MRRIGIGLIGFGTVGQGVARLLSANAEMIAARLGATVALQRIALRDPARARNPSVESLGVPVTTDWRDVVDDRDVRVVCEVIGGLDPARELMMAAIRNGKHVVTANKHLLAEHGDEIFSAADNAGVEVHFEAAVAGGLPIIRTIREGLVADRIDALWGIVNGTSNFILTRMEQAGTAFADVLREAQAAGYAEADPTLDIEGIDAAHKIALLASLAFATRIRPGQVFTRGVSIVEAADLAWAARFGFRVKHLAIAKDHGDAIEVRVHPTLIPREWLLASVSGVLNAVYIRSRALGPSLYYGHGAGGDATAVALLGDIIDACRSLLAFRHAPARPTEVAPRPVREMGDVECRYYLRLACSDQPGVLARVAGALAAHDISIAEVVQERAADGQATLVLLTHRARERNMQAARGEIDRFDVVSQPARLLRIEE